MHSIAVVGDEGLDGALEAAVRSAGFKVRQVDAGIGASTVGDADLVVLTGREPFDERLATVRVLERHMTRGAILAVGGAPTEVALLARAVQRPEQLVGLELGLTEAHLAPTDLTAPGVVFALEAVCQRLGVPLREAPMVLLAEAAE